MPEPTLREYAVIAGKQSAKIRFKGKTKKEISDTMRKLINKRWSKKV